MELLQTFVNDFLTPLGGDPHVGLFLFTWLFSVVNPLSPPEEFFTLLTGACITAGILHPFWGGFAVLTAIIFTDVCQYWLGRGVLKLFSGTRIGNKVICSEGFSNARKKMAEKGIWAIALCRFFFGTRAATYVASGFLRFSFVKFVIVDGLAVLLQGTAFVVVGALFSEQITNIIGAMHEAGIWSLIGLLLLIGLIFLIKYLRARSRRRAAACRETSEG